MQGINCLVASKVLHLKKSYITISEELTSQLSRFLQAQKPRRSRCTVRDMALTKENILITLRRRRIHMNIYIYIILQCIISWWYKTYLHMEYDMTWKQQFLDINTEWDVQWPTSKVHQENNPTDTADPRLSSPPSQRWLCAGGCYLDQ